MHQSAGRLHSDPAAAGCQGRWREEGFQRRQWLTWRRTVQKRGTPPAHPAPCCLHSGTPSPTCREIKEEDSLAELILKRIFIDCAPRMNSGVFFFIYFSKLKSAATGFLSKLHTRKVFLGSFNRETKPQVEIQRMLHACFNDNNPTHCLIFIFITNLTVLQIDHVQRPPLKILTTENLGKALVGAATALICTSDTRPPPDTVWWGPGCTWP